MLRTNDGQIFLPFRAHLKRDDRKRYADNNRSSYYSSPHNCDLTSDDSDTREIIHPSELRELSGSESCGSIADAYAEYNPPHDDSELRYEDDDSYYSVTRDGSTQDKAQFDDSYYSVTRDDPIKDSANDQHSDHDDATQDPNVVNFEAGVEKPHYPTRGGVDREL